MVSRPPNYKPLNLRGQLRMNAVLNIVALDTLSWVSQWIEKECNDPIGHVTPQGSICIQSSFTTPIHSNLIPLQPYFNTWRPTPCIQYWSMPYPFTLVMEFPCFGWRRGIREGSRTACGRWFHIAASRIVLCCVVLCCVTRGTIPVLCLPKSHCKITPAINANAIRWEKCILYSCATKTGKNSLAQNNRENKNRVTSNRAFLAKLIFV
jgi:hypothetical protein